MFPKSRGTHPISSLKHIKTKTSILVNLCVCVSHVFNIRGERGKPKNECLFAGDLIFSRLFLVSKGSFMCHIYWSRDEQFSIYKTKNVLDFFGIAQVFLRTFQRRIPFCVRQSSVSIFSGIAGGSFWRFSFPARPVSCLTLGFVISKNDY